MNRQFAATTTDDDLDMEDLVLYRQELLEVARRLDQTGKRFERYISMQLQQLEIAIDDFDRERDAWRRQRDREAENSNGHQPEVQQGQLAPYEVSTGIQEYIGVPSLKKNLDLEANGSASAPLCMLFRPNQATAMQVGLLLFEISKLNREFGGGGVRFEVNHVRLSKGKQDPAHPNVFFAVEAFSLTPLVAYDGTPSRQLQAWQRFKSELVMSSLTDKTLEKDFNKAVKVPRDHDAAIIAFEATRRAENANNKCESSQKELPRGFKPRKTVKGTSEQQLKRVGDIVRYLKNECDLRMHLSLIW
ncbi:hypothetical protein [Thalassoglobus polymorphus]|uniref:Uncharacterized protein n=1 Tax=Thalassoglobus polymorphus TaxID=2527994 RepID=A0A517QNY8_9PLAN|nr:hypothetical protein [Thalassoglobus polymorphus]QDT33368.1 hypothetical protein Mal48_26210 [Thalassoglobus polymorphus]